MSKDTAVRLATAFVLIPIVLTCLAWGGYWWAALVALVGMQTAWEFYGIALAKGYRPERWLGVLICGVLILISLRHAEFALPVLVAGMLLSIGLTLRGGTVVNGIASASASLMGQMYIGLSLMHGIWMRELTDIDGRNVGIFALFFVMATTFLADAGGYFAGRKFGKTKLAPTVSPKKTVEGLIGSVAAAIAGGAAAQAGFEIAGYPPPIPLHWAALIGGMNAIVGVTGDLVESLFKRDADVKDSGTLLPGHGGMLDRIDAILFTIPVNYYLLHLAIWGTVV